MERTGKGPRRREIGVVRVARLREGVFLDDAAGVIAAHADGIVPFRPGVRCSLQRLELLLEQEW